MRSDFNFHNLLGTVYRNSNVVFTNDGNSLLSPVGNRVSVFNLVENSSFTFEYQHRKPISRIALNSQNSLLLSIDVDGRAILVNFKSKVVLHHFNFGKGAVSDIKFSPNGKYFALSSGRLLQIWQITSFSETLNEDFDTKESTVNYNDRQFAPFVKFRKLSGHYNDITSISWSPDSRFLLTTSKDLTTRIWSVLSDDKSAKTALAGHRESVVGAFFSHDQENIYTVSKDGAVLQWGYTEGINEESEPEGDDDDESFQKRARNQAWRIVARNYLHAPDHSVVKSVAFHPKNGMLVTGLSNGEFRLYELPSFSLVQQLSMGQNAVNAVEFNASGEWLAFGSRKLGQLIVYEWQSESYILKQQGHYDSINSLCYTPDGSRVVTGGDDGKIKLWDLRSGFCLTTFDNHQGPVTAVTISNKKSVLFSSSLDGTIRAWDLIRYRNFRTYTAPERVQFNNVALDPSGEIVVASSLNSFEVYVWSAQNGQLLDSLTGHEAPVSHVVFGAQSSTLVSASWDKTVRVWDIFGRKLHVEPIQLYADVLAVCVRPDSKQIAVSTIDGQISFWDIENGVQVGNIDCKKDIFAGRYLNDAFESKNSKRSRFFTTISYSLDGKALICGGKNNSICLYDIANEVLLNRFEVSSNMMLDGTLEMLNSSRLTEDGVNLDTLDLAGDNSDLEDRIDESLPGSKRGDPSLRNTRPEVRVSSIMFSPSSNEFAAASTEGLLVYSVNQTAVFDPFDLDVDITPQAVASEIEEKNYLVALVMAFRLNETQLVTQSFENVPVKDMKVLLQEFPQVYVPQLLRFLGEYMLSSPHLEFNMLWLKSILSQFGDYIRDNRLALAGSLKTIQRFLSRVAKDVVEMGVENDYRYMFLEGVKEAKLETLGVEEATA